VITSDKRLVKNILINLLSNAVKFSDEGSPIDLEAEPRPERRAVISGPGQRHRHFRRRPAAPVHQLLPRRQRHQHRGHRPGIAYRPALRRPVTWHDQPGKYVLGEGTCTVKSPFIGFRENPDHSFA
jgi:hypothetical protein